MGSNQIGFNVGRESSTMNVNHKQILASKIARLICYSTTHNIRITLNQFSTIGIHTARIIYVIQQIVVNVTRSLFNTKQNIINILHSSLECLFGIEQSLVLKCLVREIKYQTQGQSQKQQRLAYYL